MKKLLNLALLVVLLVFAGCAKEEIQPEPLNSSDDLTLNSEDSVLKGAKAQEGKKHFVPLKGTFEISVTKRFPLAKVPPT